MIVILNSLFQSVRIITSSVSNVSDRKSSKKILKIAPCVDKLFLKDLLSHFKPTFICKKSNLLCCIQKPIIFISYKNCKKPKVNLKLQKLKDKLLSKTKEDSSNKLLNFKI